jgi:hypothetical protein
LRSVKRPLIKKTDNNWLDKYYFSSEILDQIGKRIALEPRSQDRGLLQSRMLDIASNFHNHALLGPRIMSKSNTFTRETVLNRRINAKGLPKIFDASFGEKMFDVNKERVDTPQNT